MNVKISALKKDGGKFVEAVSFNPALISLGETVQGVLEKATFHEWTSVLVEFDYAEKQVDMAVEGEWPHGQEFVDALGLPADSVAFTKPPDFK